MKIKHDKFKVHSLTGRITIELMRSAFKSVKKNRGAAGIDKISLEEYAINLERNLTELMHELKKRTYQSIPLKRVYIPKGFGKKELRPLGIPIVKCRIAQEVVRRLINSTFDNQFHQNSFGFRPGRNCHQAIECVIDYLQQDYKYVVDADIKGFFDNIPHVLILDSVYAKISDGNILYLIERFLKSGVMEEGEFKPTKRGTPQGGVISPLLANIVLNHLDWHMDNLGYKIVRYADDFVIMCKTQIQAKEALSIVKSFLEEMELQLSKEKTHIRHVSEGFDFLGFHITSRGVSMRRKSEEKLKRKIKEITRRTNNLDQKVIEKLNQIIRGTVNYFSTKFSSVKTQFHNMDRWTRKRIRCMKYKRIWKTDHQKLKIKHIKNMGLYSFTELSKAKLKC